MNDLISVIIPVYNTQAYLKQCLDSIINQTYKNLEIICVNDGSPDDSLDILKEYQAADKRIKIIDKENGGLSSARNAAMEVCTGDYVMFVDSDDWVDTDMCLSMHDAIVQNGTDVCMCCYIKEFENHSSVTNILQKDCTFRGEDFKRNFLERIIGIKDEHLSAPHRSDVFISAWMQLFKVELVRDIRFVDTKKIGTEDWLFQVELYLKCNSVTYINKPFYHYRKTNESSLTRGYKKDLFDKWMTLYSMAADVLKRKDVYEEYKHIFKNKFAMTILFLGLNEIKSNEGIWAQAKRLKQILETDKYAEVYKNLSLKFFPIHWRLFFFLCKHKIMLPVIIMLRAIEYLRTHKKS